jgi:hypothetical protein
MGRIPGQVLPVRVNQHHRALIRARARILTPAVSRDHRNPEVRAQVPLTLRAQVQAAIPLQAISVRPGKADPPQTLQDRIASIGAVRRPAVRLLNRELSSGAYALKVYCVCKTWAITVHLFKAGWRSRSKLFPTLVASSDNPHALRGRFRLRDQPAL